MSWPRVPLVGMYSRMILQSELKASANVTPRGRTLLPDFSANPHISGEHLCASSPITAMAAAYLYLPLGMMGTSSKWVLGSKPKVRKPTPSSPAMLFTCATVTVCSTAALQQRVRL